MGIFFSKRLKELRKKSNISQAELALILGVNQKVISDYEKGAIFPSFSNLIALADYFNVSLDYLVGRDCEAVIKSAISEENKETADFFRHLYSIVNELDEKSREELLQYANYLKIKNIIKE